MPNKYLPKILHKGELIEFDDKILRESIQNEAAIIRQEATVISKEVMRQFIVANTKITTKPMIREKTCSVMVDLGYLEARKRYTRIGMSMYEAKAIFEVDYPIESKMRQIYEHMEQEYYGVKELKYDD